MNKALLLPAACFSLSAALLAQDGIPAPKTNAPSGTERPSHSGPHTPSSDADFQQKIVGVWELSVTNASQWMSTRTEYRTNGTYVMQGDLGTTDRSFTGSIGDSGVWRVENGYLFTTVTNNARGRINGESRDAILSITAERFTYRTDRDQIRTAVQKEPPGSEYE